jgi:hypothetical protein
MICVLACLALLVNVAQELYVRVKSARLCFDRGQNGGERAVKEA